MMMSWKITTSKGQPRWWRTSLLAMVVAMGIVACNTHSSPPENNKPFISDNVNSSELTRTVNHALGTTKVPTNPKRIVGLSFYTIESLLAMEIEPQGVIPPESKPHLQKALQEIAKVGLPTNIEKVLRLKPDLILGSTYSEDIYDQLSQIAPTVLAEYDGSDSWKAIHQTVGEATNQREKAEQVLANYRSRLETLREKLENRADTIEISVIRIYPDRISLIQKGSFSGSILEDANLSRPPSQRGKEVGRKISKEQLSLADGDVIFVWTHTNTERERRKTKSILKELQSDPLWSKLEAVQQGNVYPVNGSHWIGSGPIAANLVIDDLFRYLVEEDS